MTQFKVWDPLNGEEEEAEVIESYSAEEAAELYAKNDVDGHTDGLYHEGYGGGGPHPIRVLNVSSGLVVNFNVVAEPRFFYRATEQK